jgi:hypothetical protein
VTRAGARELVTWLPGDKGAGDGGPARAGAGQGKTGVLGRVRRVAGALVHLVRLVTRAGPDGRAGRRELASGHESAAPGCRKIGRARQLVTMAGDGARPGQRETGRENAPG